MTGRAMKNLIFINGTMGVGKTATSRELQKILAPSVFLDGDWCWNMEPFIVTDETKKMVTGNICYMLNSFLGCTEFQNIIFCWVMDRQAIIDSILEKINLKEVRYYLFTLTASEEALRKRLNVDISRGIRTADILERSCGRLPLYEETDSVKIDVSNISVKEAAETIAGRIV